MTTPGGVPNLPTGALTVSTLGQKLQDQSAAAMRGRAGERVPSIFNSSTGGNILSDLTPFGIITRIWSEVNSLIALSDPMDIQGPEDIPQLLIDFIEGLPVVGQFTILVEAFTGNYTGDDPALLAIQELLSPIVELAQNIVEVLTGAPGALDDLRSWAEQLPLLGPIVAVLTGDAEGPQDLASLGIWARGLLTQTSNVDAGNLVGQLSDSMFSVLPVSHINITSPNLLAQGAFESSSSIAADSGWAWDPSENRTGIGGSARATANGSLLELFSNQTVKVVAGDKLNLSASVKTSAAFSGANSVVLSLIPFVGTTQQSTVPIATTGASGSPGSPLPITLPGTFSTTTTTMLPFNLPATFAATDVSPWVTLAGDTWTVPEGVTSVRVRLAVSASASSGYVWFDDITLTKSGLLGQNLVEYLLDAWNNLWDGAFGTTGTVGKTFSDIFSAVNNLLNKANTGIINAGTAIGQTVTLATNLLNSPHNVLGPITDVVMDGVAKIGDFLTGLWQVFTGSTSAFANVERALAGALGITQTANLGLSNANVAVGTATAADGKATTAGSNITTLSDGIYNGWYGSGGTGSVAQVQTTVAAIKTAVAGGWTLETLTTSGTWTRPWSGTNDQPKEFWAICIGGGGGGGKGPGFTSGGAGGDGGLGGGYVAQQIDPAGIGSSVSYTIGAGATGKTSGTTAAVATSTTSFGSLATSNTTVGSIASLFGYYDASSSQPGSGGDGGTAFNTGTVTAGTAGGSGGSTPLATGGTGGAYSSNNIGGTGGTGGTASMTGQTRSGGGGGGGGGGARTGAGGLGGNGGFPGGGAGGGGGSSNDYGGNGGNGANGVIILLYK